MIRPVKPRAIVVSASTTDWPSEGSKTPCGSRSSQQVVTAAATSDSLSSKLL